MRFLQLTLLVVGMSIFLAACGGGAAPANSYGDKPVNIRIESNPNPAMIGDVTFTLVITEASGNPLEGARVDVSLDHTDMTGMGMSGPATEQGEGKYAINANLSMSGNWKMTVYVLKDSLDYKEDIELKVQ